MLSTITRTDDHAYVNGCARIANLFADALGTMALDKGDAASHAETMTREQAEAILAERAGIRGRRTARELAARAFLNGETASDSREWVGASLVSADDVERADVLRRSALALAQDAGVLARLLRRTGGDERVADALAVKADAATTLLAQLFTLNPDAFAVWQGRGHLTGTDAALRHNKGTAWTASLKGHDATGRDVDGVSNNKAHRSTIAALIRVNEAALMAEIEAAEEE